MSSSRIHCCNIIILAEFKEKLLEQDELFCCIIISSGLRGASLVAQRLKCLRPTRETWVRSLGQEDPLEKEMVTYSSILA